MQSHEKESIHPIALSPNCWTFLHLRMRPKVHHFDLQWEEGSDFLHAVAIQAGTGKNFNLTFEENRSLLPSMTAKICCKMLMKLSVNHFQSTEFSMGDWQTLKLVLFYNQDCNLIAGLKVSLKVVLNCIDPEVWWTGGSWIGKCSLQLLQYFRGQSNNSKDQERHSYVLTSFKKGAAALLQGRSCKLPATLLNWDWSSSFAGFASRKKPQRLSLASNYH